MKRLLLLLVLICSKQAYAQNYVTIPDVNFAAWLRINVRTAMNGNQLDTSSQAVVTLTSINVQNKNISNLFGIQYFSSLTYLNCNHNLLNSLPDLPASLKYLSCGLNPLTSIPALPTSLQTLVCYGDSLRSLPDLPVSLQNLVCYHNQLSSLPDLPTSLIYLDCSNNSLHALPNLPNLQQTLYCNNNQLKSLPALPELLIQLNCENNSLSNLPTLPKMLHTLVCYNNHITCFPVFPSSIVYGSLNIIPNPFTCLPNYIPAIDSLTQVTIPLCGEGNQHSCPVVMVSLGADSSRSFAFSSKNQVLNVHITGKQSILVFDVIGNVVLIQDIADNVDPSKEDIHTIIDASNLQEGVYTICTSSNTGLINKRLVIVK